MAYVLWRVFMKKYTTVRLGIYKSAVTPTGRPVRAFEDSWKAIEDNHETQDKNKDKDKDKEKDDLKPEELIRQSEERQSKTKRVKNYIKKCKSVLAGSSQKPTPDKSNPVDSPQCAYWYVDNEDGETLAEGETVLSDCEFERVGPHYVHNRDVNVSEETLVDESAIEEAGLNDSLPTLVSEQDVVEESKEEEEKKSENECKGDVSSLVDRLFGHLYPNFSVIRPVLVRQARDLLVCEFLGNLAKFEQEFCVPAAELIREVKEHGEKECLGSACGGGFPLVVSSCVALQLGALPPGLVRARDCYLCVRGGADGSRVHLAVVARRGAHLTTTALSAQGLATMADVEERCMDESDTIDSLPSLLHNLLLSVEHSILRVPLDDLALPCPQCLQYQPLDRETSPPCGCQCQCPMPEPQVVKKDTAMQTTPMFEFAGAIPHIDSDEDEVEWRSQGSLKRSVEVTAPKSINDLPEKLLMSGINLPGTHDRLGRPIVLCDAPCVSRAGLNRYEVATLLLYYASIPSKQRIDKGLSILVLAETGEDTTLDILDKAFLLITAHVKISSILIWRPGKNTDCPALPNSKLQPMVIPSETALLNHISTEQAPASCGGSCTHDQLEWVEFFRELEPFVEQCQTVGKALLGALADIRDQEMPPMQMMRRFLHHQQRQLHRALADPTLSTLRRTGGSRLESLTERAQWLTGSEDVRRRSLHSRHSFHVAEKVCRRLEALAAERKQALEELARLRALEDEVNEISLWLQTEGSENMKNHCNQLLRVANSAEVREQNQEFEKFYFIAMRQIDKAGDLFESSTHCQGPKAKKFKDTTQQLKQDISTFSDQLEDTRQRLEDTSRCFDLLARCLSTSEESKSDIMVELNKMAAKSGNEKLIEICQEINETSSDAPSPPPRIPPCDILTSTPLKPNGQHRRRSVSSFAFIYKCNHHAAGVSCDCWESELEDNTTESARLKKKYVQSLQSCSCKAPLDRKNSLGLDNIKEEDLLETEKNDSGVSGCGRCDSGMSSSVCQSQSGDEVYKKVRTCACQYCGEGVPCSESSSGGSHADHNERQYSIEESDVFPKSTISEELEETDEQYNNERNKSIPPIIGNSHLYCRASNLDLPNIPDQSLDPKTQKTILLIMREMIQTERDYVRSLNYVIENYIPELLREDIPQALRGQRNVVFGNIEKIYEFHSQQFLRELEMCENSPLHVGQIFLRHRSKFSLYALYNKNKPKSDSLMTEYGRIFFKSKQIQLQDNLDLASYLLKPVQRMGKYALLLQQLMKACPELPEGSPERSIAEREDLISAEEMVKFQLRHGNDLLAMDSIRECDVNLKEQGRLLRQNEFLVSEGRGAKKSLRQVFLFEELILFSKARRFPDRKNLDLYIYKNSIKMTDIGLTAKIGDSPTKFEIWFRKRKPNDTFTLQATSEEVKKLWAEELSKLLWKQAMKNREIRLQEMSSMGIGNKPCLDIRPSADNINDRSISIAQLKTAPRFRNSIVGPVSELCRSTNRPHSIISVSSVSSGSTSSAGSGGTLGRHLPAATGLPSLPGLQFDSSETSHSRSHTLNSQCSMESGIIADISIGSDDCPESQLISSSCWPLQKSNSQNSTHSTKYTSNSSQTDDTQLTFIHVPDDVPINI